MTLSRVRSRHSRYAHLARLRLDGGYASYLAVLDAERNLFQAQIQLAQSKAQLHFAVVALYMGLGSSLRKKRR